MNAPSNKDFRPQAVADTREPLPGADGLRAVLAQLAEGQERALASLLEAAGRWRALADTAAEPSSSEARERYEELARAALDLLLAWKELGGSLHLLPPEELDLDRRVVVPLLLREARAPRAPAAVGSPREEAPQAVRSPQPVSPGAHRQPPPPRDWTEELESLLSELRQSRNAQEEMERIYRASSQSFTRWTVFPKPVQRALVGNLACRLRHLQDHLGVTGSRLDAAFRSLTRYSKVFQPGWVNGLTRGRGPSADTWADEARAWWEQLVAVAGGGPEEPGPERAAFEQEREEALEEVQRWIDEWRQAPEAARAMCLEKSLAAIRRARELGVPPDDPELCELAGEIYDHLPVPDFLGLRRAIRDREAAAREDRGLPPDEIPEDWPWWGHTARRRALLVGAPADDELRQRVERAFGFLSLEALTGEDAAEQGLQRVLDRRVDLLVLHAGEDDRRRYRSLLRACQETGTSWVLVEGAGVTRIRSAIERFLQPESSPRRG